MAPEKNGSGAGTSREEAPVKVPAKDPKENEGKKDEDLRYLVDILSILALTMSAEGERITLLPESLKYRLAGSEGDIGSWGHEYVRNLAGEIAQEYTKRQEMLANSSLFSSNYSEEAPINDLMELVQQIVAFHMKHNAEPEAVDLLMEVEALDILMALVDSTNLKKTCLYLTSAARYLPGPDDMLVLDIAHVIYLKFEEYANALHITWFLGNMQGITFELDEEMVPDDDEREALQEIVNNTKLSEGYLTLACNIEVMEPKSS